MKMIVCFDVDGTLIKQGDGKPSWEDVPRYDVIQLFKLFESFGCELYIWSGGGMDYAARWRDKLGLNAQVIAKGSIQPDLAVDDMDLDFRKIEGSLGKINLQV